MLRYATASLHPDEGSLGCAEAAKVLEIRMRCHTKG